MGNKAVSGGRALWEATAALNAAETREAVVRAVAEGAAAVCGAECASIVLDEGEGQFVVHVQCHGAWEVQPYDEPASGSIVGRVIAGGRPYRTANLAADPYTDHAFDERMGYRSQLAVPVRGADGRVLGAVSLYNKASGRRFTAQDETLLGALSMQAAVALERARSRAELAETLLALQESEQRLVWQAYSDALTALPNRALFMSRLDQALATSTFSDSTVAVMLLDLDQFKVINDSLGHGAGDDLLVEVARRLLSCVRRGDLVARFGGDEFTVLLESPGGDDVRRVAERILRAFAPPVMLDGRQVFVTASIGIAFSNAAPGVQEMLRQADVAMYRAKAAGRNRYVLFDESMHARARERLDLELDLRHAVARGQLRLYYQPQYELATGRLCGFEALVRWRHPRRGLLSPADFIPVAEETELILPIGEWVLAEACRQARIWQDMAGGCAAPVMSINLAARELACPDLAAGIADILDRTGLDPAHLRIELTETVAMDNAPTILGCLQELRAIGVRLAIDDFGTGYSSLTYLKRFPVDTIKIDREFVDGLGADPDDTAIVGAVISLAHALGLQVTAEGIETPEQLAHLRRLGCDAGQGFYLGRPMAAGPATTCLAGAGAVSEPGTSCLSLTA